MSINAYCCFGYWATGVDGVQTGPCQMMTK